MAHANDQALAYIGQLPICGPKRAFSSILYAVYTCTTTKPLTFSDMNGTLAPLGSICTSLLTSTVWVVYTQPCIWEPIETCPPPELP